MGRDLIKRLAVACSVAALGMGVVAAHAEYPDRPITLVVPWAAGGGTDATARTIAAALEEQLGQRVNVVNRPGGGGVVGHTFIASSKPDGYTLGLITSGLDTAHWLGLTPLSYKDYTIIAQVNDDPAGLQVAGDSPYRSAQELIDAIRDKPAGTFTASGVGVGGIWHVTFSGLLMDQGIDPARVRWVPSEGAAPAMLELVAGGVAIAPVSIPEARAMIDAGKARSLAVMGPKRNAVVLDAPTLKEALGTDYTAGTWRGVAGPKAMDPAVAGKLEAALEKAYQSATYQDFMKKQGFGPYWRNAAEFSAYLEKTDATMGEILGQMGLRK